MYVEIVTEAAQFPEKEYINWTFVAVWQRTSNLRLFFCWVFADFPFIARTKMSSDNLFYESPVLQVSRSDWGRQVSEVRSDHWLQIWQDFFRNILGMGGWDGTVSGSGPKLRASPSCAALSNSLKWGNHEPTRKGGDDLFLFPPLPPPSTVKNQHNLRLFDNLISDRFVDNI